MYVAAKPAELDDELWVFWRLTFRSIRSYTAYRSKRERRRFGNAADRSKPTPEFIYGPLVYVEYAIAQIDNFYFRERGKNVTSLHANSRARANSKLTKRVQVCIV